MNKVLERFLFPCRIFLELSFPEQYLYLFFDDIQRVDQWQDAVNSFRADFDCDIYVTGSNAYLLSSEYATYLAGRSVEIKMLPLSFCEFLDFHGYTIRERKNPSGGNSKRIYDTDEESYEPKELLEAYLKFGGMPGIVDVGLDTDKALIRWMVYTLPYLSNIVNGT